MSGITETDLYSQLGSKIALGNGLVEKLESLKNVRGIEKLQNKILQEVSFLKKIFHKRTAKEEHINCTNVNHFEAMVNCLLGCKDVTAVLERFYVDSSDMQCKKIMVDIICESGKKWVKVIARNAKALTQLSNGNGTYGKRNVFDQVKEYLVTAKQHPFLYKTPEVVFHFAAGIESILADQLSALGVTVCGDIIAVSIGDVNQYIISSSSESDDEISEYSETLIPLQNMENNNGSSELCSVLNLDVTTMLAYVSALTNTEPTKALNFLYRNPCLREQAEVELKQPVKPILDALFQGKELVCCQTAAESFQTIVNTVGGPSEMVRGKQLMERVRIVADNPTLPANYCLTAGGQISERSLTVFITGHNLKAITVSANESFVRSAKHQGVEFATFIHPARALTEKKRYLPTANDPQTVESTSSTGDL